MRMVGGLALSALLVTGAQAADYLRGPIPEPAYQPVPKSASYDWSGFYLGAAFGYGNGRVDPTRGSSRMVDQVLPNLEITQQAYDLLHLQKSTARGTMWSVFGGYNTQWDDVVVGAEVEYNRTGANARTAMSTDIGRTLTGASGNLWDVVFTGANSKTTVRDYGVMRARFGVAYDRFMPYLTFGIAMGNPNTRSGVTGSAAAYQLQPIIDPVSGAITGYTRIDLGSTTRSYSRSTSSAFSWGYAFGGGLDVAFTDNIFGRASYEYVGLGGFNSTNIGLHTVKAGIGTKF